MQAQDLEGKPIEEVATGFMPRVWQHEIDHLNGTLLTDRMGPVAKMANRKVLNELKEQYDLLHPPEKPPRKPSRRKACDTVVLYARPSHHLRRQRRVRPADVRRAASLGPRGRAGREPARPPRRPRAGATPTPIAQHAA